MTEFLQAHPTLVTAAMTMFVWPLLTAILTTLFKPQTPEQYAKLAVKHPKLADFWRLIGALGLDPVKALLVLQELFAKVDPEIPVDEDTQPQFRVVSTGKTYDVVIGKGGAGRDQLTKDDLK